MRWLHRTTFHLNSIEVAIGSMSSPHSQPCDSDGLLHSTIACQSQKAAGEDRSMELLDALQSAVKQVKEVCKISGVAGLSLGVFRLGRLVLYENIRHRDLARKEPVTAETSFHISSMTKAFTGVCLDVRRERRKLSLDDSIYKYVPNTRGSLSVASGTLTLSDLLGLRTGLQRADDMWLGSDGELMISKKQTLAVFSAFRPSAEPGAKFIYNNIGYVLLGEIIEKAAGVPYHVYHEERDLEASGTLSDLGNQGPSTSQEY